MLHRAKAFEEMGKQLQEMKEQGKSSIKIEDVLSMMNELSQQQMNKRMSGEEVGEIVGKFVNSMAHDEEGFVREMTSQHRTLQQNSFRLFVACMKQWSYMLDVNYYDFRNEQTVKMSKKMLESVKDESIPMI